MLSAVSLPALAVVLAYPLARAMGARAGYPLAALVGACFALLLWLTPVVLHDPIGVAYPWIPAIGAQASLHLDGLSMLFALVATGVGAVVLAYSSGYMAHGHDLPRYYLALTAFTLAMLVLVLAGDGLTLYVAWETTTLTSFLLIAHDRKGRRAAVRALLMTFAGGLALLAAMLLASGTVGTLEIREIARPDAWPSESLTPFLLLVVLAAAVKSVQAPFHVWLPAAMVAPTPVSAYLHAAAMVKAGLYVLLRLAELLAERPAVAAVLMSIGVVTALFAAGAALLRVDLKALLAYSTISQLGFMFALVGIGTPLAITACMVHVIAHATYKSALFLCAGVFDHELGTRSLLAVRGAVRHLPLVSCAVAAACVSMAGVIPAVGYLSKEEALKGLLKTHGPGGLAVSAGVVLALVLTVAYTLRVGIAPFGGGKAADSHRRPRALSLAPALLALVTALGGLWISRLAPLIESATRTSVGSVPSAPLELWRGFTPAFGVSLGVLAAGALLWFTCSRLDIGAIRRWPQDAGSRAADAVARGLDLVAATLSRGFLFPVPSSHITVLVVVVAVLVLTTVSGVGLAAAGEGSIRHWIIAVFILLAAIIVASVYDRLTALSSMATIGFLVAVWYVLHGAPQVAAVQLAVDSLIVGLAMFVLRHLPRQFARVSAPRRILATVAALAGGTALGLLVLASSSPDLPPASLDYLAEARRSDVDNLVSEIIAKYRAFDTLAEATVVAMAALGATALLRWKEIRT